MTKRWTALLCALLMALSLAACGGAPDEPSSSSQAPSSAPSSEPSQPEESATPEADDPEPQVTNAPAGIDVLTGREIEAEGFLEGQRPVAVMIHNTERAMPQRGIGKGQLFVEMPIGGGDTAMMVLFSDYRGLDTTGPVCEMQDQFAQVALPVMAIPAYIGATQYTTNLFTVLGYKTINGVQLGTTSFAYDYNRTLPKPGGKLHEYSWYTGPEHLYAGMEFLDINLVGEMPTFFRFGSDIPAGPEDAGEVRANYSGKATTTFRYDAERNIYYDYFNGNKRAMDDESETVYRNVLLLSCLITTKEDSEQTLEFDFSGGDGWYFTRGGAQRVKWVKGGPTSPITLYDANNTEISVNTGTTYLGFLPSDREEAITWLSADEVAARNAEAEEAEEGEE